MSSEYEDGLRARTNPIMDVSASDPLIQEDREDQREGRDVETKPDPRRFYILIMFSLLVFTQVAVWNTWGAISSSANFAFQWNDSMIFLLSNWGNLTYIITTLFFAWLMDVKGLRISCRVTAIFIALGCGLRCITSQPPAATWLINVGQILNGMVGPVVMGGPPLVSAVWFPVQERTISTSIAIVGGNLGIAVSYIIAPLLVPDVGTNLTVTQLEGHNYTVPYIRDKIMLLMYIEFTFSAALALLICIYFPSHPANAPSVTATISRVPFKLAIKALFMNYRFWMLSIPYAMAAGIGSCWGSVLDVILKSKDISQNSAGWIGFFMTIAAIFFSVFGGALAIIFTKKMKMIIVIANGVSFAFFGVFTLMYIGVIPLSKAGVYTVLILQSGSIATCGPLLYELVCEATFPVAEGITSVCMTSLFNLFGLVFLLIPMFYTGTTWMNWVYLATIVLCIPAFAMFPERYERYDIDTHIRKIKDVIEEQPETDSTHCHE